MNDILCVTNRKLCGENFLGQIEKIAALKPGGIIVREKDLPEKEYTELAECVQKICRKHKVMCILHTYINAAAALKTNSIHMPLPDLRLLSHADRKRFHVLGASCHSEEEAVEAEKLGCTYITCGHIFESECKKGIAPKGIGLLKDVCRSVKLPVYAIGGINAGNIHEVVSAGAKGACVMSGAMTSDNLEEYFSSLKSENKDLERR